MENTKVSIETETEPLNTDKVTNNPPDDETQKSVNEHSQPNSCWKLTPWVKKKLLQTFTLCASIWMFGQSQISDQINIFHCNHIQATWCWTGSPATSSISFAW